MLPPVTLETKIPPFSPLTMEMPNGSAPLCTMTLRGSSRYGLVGGRNVKARAAIQEKKKKRGNSEMVQQLQLWRGTGNQGSSKTPGNDTGLSAKHDQKTGKVV